MQHDAHVIDWIMFWMMRKRLPDDRTERWINQALLFDMRLQ